MFGLMIQVVCDSMYSLSQLVQGSGPMFCDTGWNGNKDGAMHSLVVDAVAYMTQRDVDEQPE